MDRSNDRATHVDPQTVHGFWAVQDEATGDTLVEVSYGVPAQRVTLRFAAHSGLVGVPSAPVRVPKLTWRDGHVSGVK